MKPPLSLRPRLAFSGLLLFVLAAVAAPAQTVPADVPASAQQSFHDALALEHDGKYGQALNGFTQANKLAGGRCAACLEAMYRTAMDASDYKAAVDSAQKLGHALPDAPSQAHAHLLEAEAEYHGSFATLRDGERLSNKGDRDRNNKRADGMLAQAEAASAQGLALAPSDEHLRFLHARVLAALKRDADATREFTACASAPGLSQSDCLRAAHFAHNVEAARDEASPEFTFTATDSKPYSRASLAGKVVLLDFWATWCVYCRRDSDYVQSLLDSFAPDKFVLVEVDVDEDADKWKDFVRENRLHGLQVRDADGSLRAAFHVDGYPTYVILDGDSQVRYRISGAQGDLRGTIRKLIAEQPSAPAATAPSKAAAE